MSLKGFLKKGLDEKDKIELMNLLTKLKNINETLTAKYELRNDLVYLTDKRQGAARVVKEEVETLRQEINSLKSLKQVLKTEIDVLLKLKSDIDDLAILIDSETNLGDPLPNAIQDLLNVENYEDWLDKSKTLNKVFEDICLPIDEDEPSKAELIKKTFDESEKLNKYLFETDEKVEVEGVPTSRNFLLRRNVNLINDYHKNLFISSQDEDGNELPSIASQIDKKKSELESFHTKIFGSNNPQKISLSTALDERLKQLKQVEDEAKRIMNLSSTAGLAGGFFEKAKEAKQNKWGSLIVFSISLILLAIFNFCTIDWDNLDKITLQSIAIRTLLNIPLLWIATVANINLNKYSRLEQEYGHKEALAKSYEKYRDEISKLPNLDNDKDNLNMGTLHAELIKLNLEAFKKNPTDDMDKARANFFADRFFNSDRETEKPKEKTD